jgi:hypothetical protein
MNIHQVQQTSNVRPDRRRIGHARPSVHQRGGRTRLKQVRHFRSDDQDAVGSRTGRRRRNVPISLSRKDAMR